MSDDKKHRWEELVEEVVDKLSKEVLYDLTRWEFDELTARDPSFEDLAKKCRQVIAQVQNVVIKSKVMQSFLELVEILESVATSIVERNAKLLVDCITHLQEFIEIRKNGGA